MRRAGEARRHIVRRTTPTVLAVHRSQRRTAAVPVSWRRADRRDQLVANDRCHLRRAAARGARAQGSGAVDRHAPGPAGCLPRSSKLNRHARCEPEFPQARSGTRSLLNFSRIARTKRL